MKLLSSPKLLLVSLLLVESSSFELIMKIYTNLHELFFVVASYILICPNWLNRYATGRQHVFSMIVSPVP